MDFRVGGRELERGGPPDGPEHRFDARYHEIVPNERIVFAYDMYVGDTQLSVSLSTVELAPEGDRTRLVFTEQGAFFDGHEDPALRANRLGLLAQLQGLFAGVADLSRLPG